MSTKTHQSKFKSWVLSAMALLLFGTLAVEAQDPAQLKEGFARAHQQNDQALRQYTWKSRNEVRKNTEVKNTQVFQMRYDAFGNLQRSQIGGSAPPHMPKGPIFGHIAQKKKEDFVELMGDLREQVQAYSQLSPAKMQAFLSSATISGRLDQGVIQIQGGNILQAGDGMTIWLDAKTRRQRRVEILTFVDRNPVRAVIEFGELPAGPTFMARTVVNYQKESLQLITENFDYERTR